MSHVLQHETLLASDGILILNAFSQPSEMRTSYGVPLVPICDNDRDHCYDLTQ